MLIHYDIDNTMQILREIPFFRPQNSLYHLRNVTLLVHSKCSVSPQTLLINDRKHNPRDIPVLVKTESNLALFRPTLNMNHNYVLSTPMHRESSYY